MGPRQAAPEGRTDSLGWALPPGPRQAEGVNGPGPSPCVYEDKWIMTRNKVASLAGPSSVLPPEPAQPRYLPHNCHTGTVATDKFISENL